MNNPDSPSRSLKTLLYPYYGNKKYLAWLSFLLAAIFGYLEAFRVDLTNDTNYFMHCALALWRFGPGQLYDRCIDENFPYHIVAYSPLAAFAAYYHIDPAIVLNGTCACFCVFSLYVLERVLKAHQVDVNDRYLWLAVSALALLVLPSIYGVFADREHFLFIFALPWILQMVLCFRPLTYTCVMAGFGFLMKPHDFALFGIMTLFCGPADQSFKERLFSKSTFIIGAMGALYAVLLPVFFPKFVFEILPYALVIYPNKYYSFSFKFGYAFKYIVIAGGIALAFVKPGYTMVSWFAFIAGCMAVFFLNAGWDYTFYLVSFPAILALALPWISYYGSVGIDRKNMIRAARLLTAGVILICVVSICLEMGVLRTSAFRNHNTVDPRLYAEIHRDAGDKMIILSLNVWNSQVEPFARTPETVFGYDTVWTYPWLSEHPDSPYYLTVMHSLTSHFLNAVRENPTAVIFDDVSPLPRITPDGILGFLARDAEVKEAIAEYTLEKTVDYCSKEVRFACRFAVLKREDIKTP